MIQRIQSIFLLTMTIVLPTATAMPIWSQPGALHLNAWQLLEEHSTGALAHHIPYALIGMGCWLAAMVAFYELLRYDNRSLQLKLGMLNNLLVSAVLFSILYLTSQPTPQMLERAPGKYQLGFFLLIIALVSNLLANYFIRRDEKLVRSADRMR